MPERGVIMALPCLHGVPMTPTVKLAQLRPEQRRQLLWLLLYTLVLLGVGMGLRDPWPSDEPRFALVAQWMVEHGQWLFPHRGHELYPDKPPVFMWLQALSYGLTGIWRVAFLLPSLAAGLLCCGLVYDLGRRLWNHRVGIGAALLMVVSIQFSYQFRHAQIDPLVVAWITLANYGLLRHLLLGPAWRWYGVGCFFAGVGVITKGVGFLALLMLLPYVVARLGGWRNLARPVGAWRWAAGAGLFVLPIAAWLVPMVSVALSAEEPIYRDYMHNILLGQTVNRYVAFGGHSHGLLYLPGVILLEWLPWTLALPWAIPAWWRRLKRRDARYLLPLAWVVLVVLFFSMSSGKRDVYIMPALPMAMLALGPMLGGLLQRAGPRRLLCALTLLLSALLLVAGMAGMWLDVGALEKLQAKLEPQIWWLLLAYGGAGLLVVALTRVRRAALGWVAFLTCLWGIHGLWGYPMLNADRSALGIMQEARQVAGPGVTLGMVAWKEQNLLQAQGPVVEFGFLRPWPEQYAAAVAWMGQNPVQRRLFIRGAAMGDCVRRQQATHLGKANRRDWWVVPMAAVIRGCQPDGK